MHVSGPLRCPCNERNPFDNEAPNTRLAMCGDVALGGGGDDRPKSTIVVVDWGGGGVEATVLRRTDGALSVAGQAADPSVGGGVFTERLVKFCAKDFKRRTGGDIFESRRSLLKVRNSRCWN